MPSRIPDWMIVDQFLLADADWPIAKTLDALRTTEAPLLVLRRLLAGQPDNRPAFYVYEVPEAIDLVERFVDRANAVGFDTGDALGVHEWGQRPVARVTSPPAGLERGTVIVRGRGLRTNVAGVFYPRVMAAMVDPMETGATSLAPTTNGQTGDRRRRGDRETAAGPVPVEVTRSLVAEVPGTISVGDNVALTIWLAIEAPAGGHAATISAPLGSDIEVTVRTYRGIELVGTNTHAITVTEDEETPPILFTIKATATGSTKLVIYAFRDGRNVASIRIPIEVVAAAAPTGAPVELRAVVAPTPPAGSEPDLELHVLESEDEHGREYELRLTSRSDGAVRLLEPVGTFTLDTDPLAFFRKRFEEIEKLPITTDQQLRDAIAKLQRLGSYLFENILPAKARERIWELRDQIACILVQSEEPWIPWEIIRISGRENGRIVEKGILCETYSFGRTRPDTPSHLTLSLKNLAVIAPRDANLPAAVSELAYLKTLASPNRKVTIVPAKMSDVLDALTAGEFDGFHFCGHGEFAPGDPDASMIHLEGGHVLRPDDISGAVANLGLAKPIVVLNACESGRQSRSLSGTGGWAEAFLQAGCGAFVSTHWSIVDSNGEAFSRAFYPALLTGKTLGEAVRAARHQLFTVHEPDYLAYVMFGHPLAKVG